MNWLSNVEWKEEEENKEDNDDDNVDADKLDRNCKPLVKFAVENENLSIK